MTLEVLFAREGQGTAFLLAVLFGAAAGLVVRGCGAFHGAGRIAGALADALGGMALTAGALALLLQTGAGIHLYVLLGVFIGAALYLAGMDPVVMKVGQLLRKSFSPQAGKRDTNEESFT